MRRALASRPPPPAVRLRSPGSQPCPALEQPPAARCLGTGWHLRPGSARRKPRSEGIR